MLRDIWSFCDCACVLDTSRALLSRHMAILATLHHACGVIAAKASILKINTCRRKCAVEPLGKCSLLSKHVILIHGRVRAIHGVQSKMPIGLGSKDRVTDVVTCSAERTIRVIGRIDGDSWVEWPSRPAARKCNRHSRHIGERAASCIFWIDDICCIPLICGWQDSYL